MPHKGHVRQHALYRSLYSSMLYTEACALEGEGSHDPRGSIQSLTWEGGGRPLVRVRARVRVRVKGRVRVRLFSAIGFLAEPTHMVSRRFLFPFSMQNRDVCVPSCSNDAIKGEETNSNRRLLHHLAVATMQRPS